MPKFRRQQFSFASGVLSRGAYAREDTDIFGKSAAVLDNVYVTPFGGIKRREGLEYVATITGSIKPRLVAFEFNAEQAYALVFTVGRMDAYREDTGAFVSTLTTGLSGLTESVIAQMRWTQSADTLIITHKDIQPLAITRTGATTFTATAITLSNIPVFPFGSVTTTSPAGSVVPSAVSGEITLTGTGTNFTSAYVNQYILMPNAGQIFVTAVGSTTSLTGKVVAELANTSSVPTGQWQLESGYEPVISVTRGWPRTVAFHASRLWFGGTKSRPQTLLASKIGDFYNLDTGSGLDDEALDITLDDDRVNHIMDIFPGRGLQIFTTGGEFAVRPTAQAITPAAISGLLFKETLHGSGPAPGSPATTRWPYPVSVDGATIYTEMGSGIIRNFLYSDIEQSFLSPNISILAQDIVVSPQALDVRRSTTNSPADYVFIVCGDGNLAVMHAMRDQNILSFTRFTTQGTFIDVAVPARTAYFVVQRTVDEDEYFFLERLNPDHRLDCSVKATSPSPADEWSGLDHLDGEEINVQGDGLILQNATPDDGDITASLAVSELEAGLPFYALCRTLNLQVVLANFQSWMGQVKSVVKVDALLENSQAITISYNSRTTNPPFRRFGPDVLDAPSQSFSGWKTAYIGGHSKNVYVEISQTEALDFHVLGLVFTFKGS
jgi:hypothetical protein